ncbi:MAG: hypothetical protein AAGI38_06960 [Bacteroidota bacterium]
MRVRPTRSQLYRLPIGAMCCVLIWLMWTMLPASSNKQGQPSKLKVKEHLLHVSGDLWQSVPLQADSLTAHSDSLVNPPQLFGE